MSRNIILPSGGGSLWVPGMGDVPLHLRASVKAIEEYDPELQLARNEETGMWCIFIERRDQAPFPVFSLGEELPQPEDIKRMLYQADVRRRGHKILAEVERNNQRQRDALAYETNQAALEVAENVEFAMRKLGATSHKKVVLNERVKK